MSKADDELFGLKSSRTGEYLHSKSADELFENMGYEKTNIYYHSKIFEIDYSRKDDKWASNVCFFLRDKPSLYVYYGEEKSAGHITMDILQAINEKVKELRLVRRRR